MTIISGRNLIHDFRLKSSRQTKFHPRSCLNTANWAHEKNFPGPVPENSRTNFGNIATCSCEQKFIYMAPNSRKEQFPGTCHGTQFSTWHKTQVSATFPRTFPGIETASSWDLCPANLPGAGGGGGLETARGTLGQPKEFIGRLGVFVMSLWQCWFIQFDLLTPTKPQPLHDQYADAKHHYDHANPKMAFQFARAATCNLSQHGHRNLDKERAIINVARMRCGDCHENRVSGNFQKFI